MKLKLTFLAIVAIVFASKNFAQPVLTYETHGILAGDLYEVQQTDYIDPGEGGANQTWDFSSLMCQGTQLTRIEDAVTTESGRLMPSTNIAIIDNGTTFYHEIDNTGNRYKGIVKDNSLIEFNEPIVKMVYPFAYRNSYSGTYTGHGLYVEAISSEVQGSYHFEADGYGTLKLPNNVVVTNVLRVKSVQSSLEVTLCNFTAVENTKYLWFSADYRYPIVSVMISKETSSGKNVKWTKKTFFNDQVTSSKTSIPTLLSDGYTYKVFPNPFKDDVKINLTLSRQTKVRIEVYDASGKMLTTLANEEKNAGNYEIPFYARQNGYISGTYYIKLVFNNKAYLEKIVEIE